MDRDISTSSGDCLRITANNTYIVGAPRSSGGDKFTISASGRAVYNYNKSCLTVKNIRSSDDLNISGDSADGAVIEDSNFSGLTVFDADYTTFRRNSFSSLYIGGDGDALTSNLTFTDNSVTGTASKLVSIRGYGSAGRESPPPPECSRTGLSYRVLFKPCEPLNHYFARNQFTNDWNCSTQGSCDEPMVVYMWCANTMLWEDNTITATDDAQGIRMRDEADNIILRRNTVFTARPDAGINGGFGTLNITSGNNDPCYTYPPKNFPAHNTFENNVFHSGTRRAVWVQGLGPGNTFLNNVFWAHSGEVAAFSGPYDSTWRNNTFFNAGAGGSQVFNMDLRNTGHVETFENNLMVTMGSTAVAAGMQTDMYTSDYNGFVSSNLSQILDWGDTTDTLANWRAHFAPDDANSTATLVSSSSDLPFVDAAQGNFRLKTGSPFCQGGRNGIYRGAFSCNSLAPGAPSGLTVN